MATYFKQKKCNFTMIPNEVLRDNNLSRKAKGLYAEIYSYITIPNFKLSKSYLMKQGLEGETAFNSMWNELKEKGYLKQYRIRSANSDNGFIYEYDLLDKPDLEKPYLINIKIDGSQGAKNTLKNIENKGIPTEKNTENLGNDKNNTLDFVPPRFSTLYNSHMVQEGGYINNTNLNNTDLNNTYYYEEKIEKEKPEVSKKANHKKEEPEKNAPTSQEIVDAYNETCVSLPRVAKITDKRKKALKKISSKFSIGDIRTVFKKAQESSFLNGSTDKWSGATFDWLVKEDNIVKVLEGNYDDKNAKRKNRPHRSYNLDEFQNYSIFDDE